MGAGGYWGRWCGESGPLGPWADGPHSSKLRSGGRDGYLPGAGRSGAIAGDAAGWSSGSEAVPMA